MKKYVVMARPPRQFAYSEWGESHPTIAVIETDGAPRNTGLYDANGVAIYAVEDRAPVGFKAA